MFRTILVAVATVLGVLARYVLPVPQVILGFLALGVLVAIVHQAARRCVVTHPVWATWGFQIWLLGGALAIAATTFAATWLALAIPGLLPAIPEAEADTVSGVVVGALNALIAAAWLDEAKDPEGTLWPGARHRAALLARWGDDPRFDEMHERSEIDERLYQAAFTETAENNAIQGWGLKARLHRARVIGTYA